MSERRDARAIGSWADLGVRFLLLIGTIALAWVALRRHTAFLEYSSTTGELHAGIWFSFIGVLALAGVAAGFASRLPSRGAWAPPEWVLSFAGTTVVQSVLGLLAGLGVSARFPTGRTTH